MYVIADIEWVTTRGGKISPVQLAAVRVDENWNEINSSLKNRLKHCSDNDVRVIRQLKQPL